MEDGGKWICNVKFLPEERANVEHDDVRDKLVETVQALSVQVE